MADIYILISLKDGKKYIGSTPYLEKRIKQHNNGLVKSTKYRRPFKLYATRKMNNLTEARIWERKYKNSHGQLERDIKKGFFKIYGD